MSRTADEIRGTAKAWVEVYELIDPMNVVSGKSFSYRLVTQAGRVVFAAITEFISGGNATDGAASAARDAELPALYGNAVLYDPPSRAVAVSEAVRPWKEALAGVMPLAEASSGWSVKGTEPPNHPLSIARAILERNP